MWQGFPASTRTALPIRSFKPSCCYVGEAYCSAISHMKSGSSHWNNCAEKPAVVNGKCREMNVHEAACVSAGHFYCAWIISGYLCMSSLQMLCMWCYICWVWWVEWLNLLIPVPRCFFLLLLSANFRMVFCNTEQDATVLYSYKLYTSLSLHCNSGSLCIFMFVSCW